MKRVLVLLSVLLLVSACTVEMDMSQTVVMEDAPAGDGSANQVNIFTCWANGFFSRAECSANFSNSPNIDNVPEELLKDITEAEGEGNPLLGLLACFFVVAIVVIGLYLLGRRSPEDQGNQPQGESAEKAHHHDMSDKELAAWREWSDQ